MEQKIANDNPSSKRRNRASLFFVAGVLLLVASILYFSFSDALALVFLACLLFTLFLLFGLSKLVIGKSDFRSSENEDVSNQVLGFLIAKVIMADGKSTEPELAVAKSRLQTMFRSKQVTEVLDSVFLYLKPEVNEAPYDTAVEQLKDSYDYLHLLAVSEMLFTIAVMQGGIVDAEWNFLKRVVELLDLTDADSNYLYKKYAVFRVENKHSDTDAASSPYSVLGLNEAATSQEIDNAYQNLSEKYNPRNIQDETLKNVLSEKFKEIECAYLKLKK